MKNILIILFTCFIGSVFSQNKAPEISNLNITLTGSETVLIQYDLFDFENDDVTISLHVKDSAGEIFTINTQNASGDINTVTPGVGKAIEWNFTGELTASADYTFKLVAEDEAVIDIQSIVDQVDSNNLKSDLNTIVGIRHRNTGPQHLELTRDYIAQRFADHGLNSSVQEFDFGTYTGKNYIGTIPGTTDDEFVYICDAHYDSESQAPGADDNGSGVVGFLEAARILSNYNFKKTIKFIGFDLEEAGLIGSQAYVNRNILQDEKIAGVLNFEMIGYYTEEPNSQSFPNGFNLLFPNQFETIKNDQYRGNFIANFGLTNQSDWAESYSNAAATYVPDLKVITFLAPPTWSSIAPDIGRSDHAPFWLTGNPAVMLTGTANFRNPNYHLASDTTGTLNFTFMSNVVKAAVATLAEQAEIHNSSFVEETINITITSTNEPSICDFTIGSNPVSDILSIQLSNCNSNYSRVQIYDVNGKLVVEETISKTTNNFKLDVKNWQNGIYFLKSNDGQVVKKIVVQH